MCVRRPESTGQWVKWHNVRLLLRKPLGIDLRCLHGVGGILRGGTGRRGAARQATACRRHGKSMRFERRGTRTVMSLSRSQLLAPPELLPEPPGAEVSSCFCFFADGGSMAADASL